MDHFNDTPNQVLAKAIITQTKTDLYNAAPTLHMEFHHYVSYPAESHDGEVLYHTTQAIDEFNLTPRTDAEKRPFYDRMNNYGKLLFDTHKKVKKELINF